MSIKKALYPFAFLWFQLFSPKSRSEFNLPLWCQPCTYCSAFISRVLQQSESKGGSALGNTSLGSCIHIGAAWKSARYARNEPFYTILYPKFAATVPFVHNEPTRHFPFVYIYTYILVDSRLNGVSRCSTSYLTKRPNYYISAAAELSERLGIRCALAAKWLAYNVSDPISASRSSLLERPLAESRFLTVFRAIV